MAPPLQYSCLENPMDGGAWKAAVYGVAEGQTWLSDFTFTFHFHALEKEMATHSSVLAWRIPGTGEPGGLQSMGSHRVGHNWSDLAVAAYASKVILKILQARFKHYMNRELPDVQAGFWKGRGTRDQIANIHWIIKKVREFQENIYFCFIDYAKAYDCVDHNRLWKILQGMEISDHLTCLLRNLYVGQEATVRLDMEQQTGSKLGKEYIKAVYCHPAYLTYMQSTSCEMLDWMKHKMESRLPGEMSITSYMQMTPPLWQKVKKN